MAKKRRRIPEAVRRHVLMEAGYRCGVPTCRNILAIDLHHIVPVSEDGGNEPDNLLPLCGLCHDLHHRGEIPPDAIRIWKGILVALNRAFDHETIDNLLFLQALDSKPRLIVSGDGVLRFSRLIAAGLATFKWQNVTRERRPDTYSVALTDKGKLLVEAWTEGNAAALEDVLVELSTEE